MNFTISLEILSIPKHWYFAMMIYHHATLFFAIIFQSSLLIGMAFIPMNVGRT